MAAAEMRLAHPHATAKRFGDLMHLRAEQMIRAKGDPDFVAELSLRRDGNPAEKNEAGSVRLDIFENNRKRTVCGYDYKTGDARLYPARALELATAASRRYPETERVIIIQSKPKIPKALSR